MSVQAHRHLIETLLTEPLKVSWAERVVVEDQAQGRTVEGPIAAQALLQAFFAEGFPGARLDVRGMVVDESGIGMVEGLFQGQQDGLFLGIPPTHRPVVLPMVLVCQIQEWRVSRLAIYYDAGTLLRQLGLAL